MIEMLLPLAELISGEFLEILTVAWDALSSDVAEINESCKQLDTKKDFSLFTTPLAASAP